MRDKEKKTGRGKEEKKRRKGGKKMGIKSQKRPCASLSSPQSSCYGYIRNTLFREKHTIFTFVVLQDDFDEQIV